MFFRNWSIPFCFVFIYACHVWGALSILLYWTFRENMWVLPRDANKRVSGYCHGNLTFFHADFAKKEKIKTKQKQKHWLSSNRFDRLITRLQMKNTWVDNWINREKQKNDDCENHGKSLRHFLSYKNWYEAICGSSLTWKSFFRVHEAVRGCRTRQNLLQELHRFGFGKQLALYKEKDDLKSKLKGMEWELESLKALMKLTINNKEEQEHV